MHAGKLLDCTCQNGIQGVIEKSSTLCFQGWYFLCFNPDTVPVHGVIRLLAESQAMWHQA